MDWAKDSHTPKVHTTQKPVPLLRRLIEIFTDKGDVVIDPVAGSGTTLLAAEQCGRKAYGFEIKKSFYKEAQEKILKDIQQNLCI
jgi:site-specific DNA-methyltransferase (adenine-specific)